MNWDKETVGDSDVKEVFQEFFKRSNYMSTQIIEYYRQKKLLCEFSFGKFLDTKIYGCTFLEMVKENGSWKAQRRQDLDRALNDNTEALIYIKETLNKEAL